MSSPFAKSLPYRRPLCCPCTPDDRAKTARHRQTACMFPRTAQHQWWFASPERKNRSQAIGLRLAIAYHRRDAASVARLLPADDDEIRLVMGALENGLLVLNQLCPPGPPDEV